MVQGLNSGYNQYQIQQPNVAPARPAQTNAVQNASVQPATPVYTAPYAQPPAAQGYQMYTVPPKIIYNQGAAPSQVQAQQTPKNAPLSNIPVQPDVLSLTTQYSRNKDINLQNPAKNMAQQPLTGSLENSLNTNTTIADSSLNAQMPTPNIKTEQTPIQIENEAAQQEETVEEKILPSLNIGVVNAPNNASLTPITDDLNSRAQDIEKVYLPETKKSASSPIPQVLGKKPLNAGKLSAYLMLGSLGLTFLMIVPKGISKIIKLIKHK